MKGRQGRVFLSSAKITAASHQATFERSHAAGWKPHQVQNDCLLFPEHTDLISLPKMGEFGASQKNIQSDP